MGVYIPNMSKPITCEECPFADSIGAFMPHTCGLTNITLADDFARMDCPLIDIPTPHGRLIDKDKLMKWLEITEECKDCKSNNYGFCSKGTEFVNACEAITTECPTIIEAEQ